MTYTLPWIIVGFYLYLRINAILTAALCIIGVSFVVIRYFNECIKSLKDIKCCSRGRTARHSELGVYRKIPEEADAEKVANQDSIRVESQDSNRVKN